jgi:MFS family permease
MTGVLANRNLRIYLLFNTLSLVGSGALWLALGIWAKSLTGSTAAAGMVIFAVLAPPVLLAPAAGMLVDRVRRRPLLIAVNLLTAGTVLLLLLVGDSGPLWLVYAVAAGYGASFAVLRSAQSALLRTIVTEDAELGAANAALQTLSALSRLLSPIAGAGLYAAVGPHSVVLLDAATFLVAAAGLALLRVVEPTPEPAVSQGASWRAEVGAGIVHLRRTVVLRQIVVTLSFAMLVVGFIEVLMFAVADAGLGRSPAFVGVLDLAFGVGAVTGGLLTARLLRRIGAGRSVTTGLVLFAAGSLLLVIPLVPVALVGMLVLGLGVPPVVAGMSTTLQRLTPLHLQGRTFSAVDVLVSTPQSLSIALGAALIAVVDHRVLLVAMTVGLLLAALYLGTRPEQRLPAATPDPEPDAAADTPDAEPDARTATDLPPLGTPDPVLAGTAAQASTATAQIARPGAQP